MTQNQKIVLLLGAAGIVAYLVWKSRKPVIETGLGKEKMQCEEEFLSANHPDVMRTPEEQDAYKKSWIADCLSKKAQVGSTDV